MERCSRGAARLILLALTTVVLTVVAAAVLAVPGAAPAGSHAQVTGTEPVDGAVVTELPERVTVFLGTKPATNEGDPIRVHGPTGERVDTGGATIVHLDGDDQPAAAVSVPLTPQAAAVDGEFRVAYRIVSEDSHLIAGTFGFTLDRPGGDEAAAGPAASGPDGAGSGSGAAGGSGSAAPGSGASGSGGSGSAAPGSGASGSGASGSAASGSEASGSAATGGSAPMARQASPPGRWPKIVFGAGVALAAAGALGRRWLRSRRDVTRRLEVVAARREAVVGGFGTRPWTD